MRTTVDLSPELMRAMKSEAAARGETVKEFLTRAVSHELGTAEGDRSRKRVKLPLVPAATTRKVDITNDDIEAIFAAEDAEKYRAQ
ncbi:hypothetical protein FHS23_003910 [Prauserella isguenensis]|uniref:Antitoxin n=1 Tax=Prauserella isguenensis TaxID=1470180 RepID=A0A839S847_9PSEU|nr:hypothetical protein [Prauserella isguenensis]MBB3052869.1 hypothetical protein [Prauserella isguenensis]